MVPKKTTEARTPAVLKVVRAVSSSRAFAKVAPHFVPALDRAVHRVSGGKAMLSGSMLPSLVLTTTGAKSGMPRPTPLACLHESGGSFIVAGSNFGRPNHPAWSGNLISNPDAEVSFRGHRFPVTGQLLEGEERAAAWEAVLEFWPPYAAYQARVERQIRLFRLTPKNGG
jgi:deazaflavin-dependent oxidoreductase (nitroreductase family)